MTELISFSVAAPVTLENPFPGLRPFREDEEHLFFGREKQVDRMVDKLAATRFLAVIGTSGTGKSSLVNCGLKPALHRGLMASAGTSWRMVQFRPGGSPVRSMAQAFASEPGFLGAEDPGGLSLLQVAQSTLRMSSLGLADLFRFARLEPGTNLLVVVDQFEELFRYSKTAGSASSPDGVSGDAIAFVNLLLEPLSHPEYPIYIVLTMRSDFLGECSKFDGLPEVINESQYLVPRLTRDERRAAIAGPVRVVGGELNPVLLTRTINDVGDNPDQLSIMQHAVNRTWAHWQKDRRGEGTVSLEDYEAVGTMSRALDEHAEEAFGELDPDKQQKLCEKVFKALTDRGTDARGIRRPMPFKTLCNVVGATPEELKPVLAVFRDPSRSFLMPPLAETLEPETVIDISHEILMRTWERLKQWADEEAQSAGTYRRLAESAELYASGKEALLRNPALQAALDWQYSETPNAFWAQMYRSGFDNAVKFLEASKQSWDLERAESEFQRRYRRFAPYLAGLMFLVFLYISPKISNWLMHQPIVKSRLHLIRESETKSAANQRKFTPKLDSNPLPETAPPDANVSQQVENAFNIGSDSFRKQELADTIINTVGYGVGGVVSGLLYGLLWVTGRRAYRRYAFPGILKRAGARLPSPPPTPVARTLASAGPVSFVAEDTTNAPVAATFRLATIWRRLSSGAIDFMVFLTLGVIAIGSVMAFEDALKIPNGSHAEDDSIFGLWLFLDFLYQTLPRQWGWKGTLGDLVCGVALVDKQGEPARFWRNVARHGTRGFAWILTYFLNAAFQSTKSTTDSSNTLLGMTIILACMYSFAIVVTMPFTHLKQAIYDMVCGTVVIRRPRKQKPGAVRFE